MKDDEITMATIKGFASLEQSKKLAEILPLESADMRYGHIAPYEFNDRMYDGGYDKIPYPKDFLKLCADFCEEDIYDGSLPCWSLASLLSVLPRFIEYKGDKYYLRFMKEYIEYANDEVSITGRCLHTTGNDNLVDACCEMIIRLSKNGLI